MRPGAAPLYTERTPRVAAARRLSRRRYADAERRFLAEGPQAVREALATGAVVEVFGTPDALARHPEFTDRSEVRVSPVTDAALAALTGTVRPQGLVAVCQYVDVPLAAALERGPRLVAVLAEVRDPGNAGTVLRTADAAGAGAVVFPAGSVDPYNGKTVRASAGSLFHPDVVRGGETGPVLAEVRAAGLRILAATGYGDTDLDEFADAGGLTAPAAWVFGNEAHGLSAAVLDAADVRVRVPMYGAAESLNLAAAAAVCLYASARAHRRRTSR